MYSDVICLTIKLCHVHEMNKFKNFFQIKCLTPDYIIKYQQIYK